MGGQLGIAIIHLGLEVTHGGSVAHGTDVVVGGPQLPFIQLALETDDTTLPDELIPYAIKLMAEIFEVLPKEKAAIPLVVLSVNDTFELRSTLTFLIFVPAFISIQSDESPSAAPQMP